MLKTHGTYDDDGAAEIEQARKAAEDKYHERRAVDLICRIEASLAIAEAIEKDDSDL